MQTYWVLSVCSVIQYERWQVNGRLSLKEKMKVELINFAKNGKGCREVAKEFDIGKTLYLN